MKRTIAGVTLLALAAMQGCKTGYNRTHKGASDPNPPDCASGPANSNLSSEGMKVFDLVAGLTCSNENYEDGYLVGQSVGYGDDLNDNTLGADSPNNHSYERLVTGFDSATTHLPAVIATDLEGLQLYTEAELLEANETLAEHWDEGGLVSISWTPLSPWSNDFSNITGNRGSAMDARYVEGSDNDLSALLNDITAVHEVWTAKLDAVAEVLLDLQERGVVVLWRPLPEMNNNTYWWGTGASDVDDDFEGAELYTDVWEHMFNRFKDKGINNLLWVYSPIADSGSDHSVTWAYPGDGFVDVVAGIARNDQLTIAGYSDMVELGRPIAMAEYGPSAASADVTSDLAEPTARGRFDNLSYGDRLDGSYPAVAYWVSPHSGELDDDTRSNLALVDNLNASELMERRNLISLERLKDSKMRQ